MNRKSGKLIQAIGNEIQLLQVALSSDSQRLMEDLKRSQAGNSRALAELADMFERHTLKTETELSEVRDIRDTESREEDTELDEPYGLRATTQ